MAITKSIEMILSEYDKAVQKHPFWPDDVIHAVAIMIGEAGEAMQAAINYRTCEGGMEDLILEIAQTGAMCVRLLENLGIIG